MELKRATIPVARPEHAALKLYEAGICMDRTKELQLIEEARSCSREAFTQLVEHYHRPLTKGFISSWSNIQYADAEDIAQEVWTKVWECIHRSPKDGGFDPTKGSYYTWVINYIAKKKVQDWRKSRSRSREIVGIPEDENGKPMIERVAESGLETEEILHLKNIVYRELFRLTFVCGGYPHEQLAFGFAKLIHSHHESDRAVEGVPKEVDSDYGEVRLKVLVDKFQDRYRAISGIDDADILQFLKASLEPVHMRLLPTVKELVRPLPKHLLDVQEEIGSQTCLRNYYPESRKTHPISYWCDRIKNKIRRVLCLAEQISVEEVVKEMAVRLRKGPIEPKGCSHCKLRHVSPCVNRKSPNEVLVQ